MPMYVYHMYVYLHCCAGCIPSDFVNSFDAVYIHTWYTREVCLVRAAKTFDAPSRELGLSYRHAAHFPFKEKLKDINYSRG